MFYLLLSSFLFVFIVIYQIIGGQFFIYDVKLQH